MRILTVVYTSAYTTKNEKCSTESHFIFLLST